MMVAAVYWLVYLRKKTTVNDYYSLIAIRHRVRETAALPRLSKFENFARSEFDAGRPYVESDSLLQAHQGGTAAELNTPALRYLNRAAILQSPERARHRLDGQAEIVRNVLA